MNGARSGTAEQRHGAEERLTDCEMSYVSSFPVMPGSARASRS
jgi:hypothetical protein